MTRQPLISVTVPVRNEAPHLHKCLDALLAQDYPNYEIICSYSTSTDNSLKILEEYARRGEITLLRDDDGDNVSSRNKMFRASRGEIILLFHARSVAERNFLSTLARKLDEHPNADGVCANIDYPEDAHPVSKAVCVTMHSWLGGHGTSYRRVKRDSSVKCPLLTAYRRSAIERTGLLDPDFRIGDDAEYNERARRKGLVFVKTPETRHYQYMRDSVPKFAVRMFEYGEARAKIFATRGTSPSIYLIPPLCLAFFAATLIAATANPLFAQFALLEAGFYTTVIAAFSLKESIERDLALLPILPLTYASEHLCFSLGMITGLAKYCLPRPATDYRRNLTAE